MNTLNDTEKFERPKEAVKSDCNLPAVDSKHSLNNGTHAVKYPDYSEDTEYAWLKEEAVAYGWQKKQGEYTLEDYYALPDDVRAELIDGVFYDMATPAIIHQSIVVRLASAFLQYIEEKGGDCLALAAPLDVQLDCDDKTMVQPDVMILCDPKKWKQRVVYGAPDLAVEVLSPSTGRKDRTIKLRKYRLAGVREYWIVDIARREVEVYIFANPEFVTLPKVYSFEDTIPVGIYDGDCKVDFSMVSRHVGEF